MNRGDDGGVTAAMRTSPVVAIAGLLGVMAGCGGERDEDLSSTTVSDAAVVEYHFSDASVPPQYHRSYTLAITAGEVRIVVDSYGDVLHDVARPLSAEAWGRVREDVAGLPASASGGGDLDDECTGGTGRELRVLDDDRVVVDLEAAACGGHGADRVEALDAVVQPVIAAVRDWDVLLAEGS